MTSTHQNAADADIVQLSTSASSQHLSRPLTIVAAVLFGAGLITGAVFYAHRSPIREVADPASWARIQHLVIAAVGALWLVIALLVGRRRCRGHATRRVPLLLAPLGQPAARRLRLTLRRSPWRLVVGLPALTLLAWQTWRAGLQVTAGLDPNETVNAWGGPGYWGALAYHYLDAAMLTAVGAVVVNALLLRPADPRRSRGRRATWAAG